MDIRPILFADSNQYFPNANILQYSIGFVNPMDIDIYVQKSFGYMDGKSIITGAYIQCFNKDHLIDDRFICYQIQGLNNTPIIKTDGFIKLNLQKQGFLGGSLIQGIIQGSPLLSLLILSILTRILPVTIGTILTYISMIGLVITCIYYLWKILKAFYLIIKSKEIDYDGIGVTFEKNSDMPIMQPELVNLFKQIHKDYKIENVYISNGTLYFKQIISKITIRQSIKNKFGSTTTDIYNTQEHIQNTIGFIINSNFK